MEIKFDYRFDTNGFFTEEKKAALNLAGDIWSILLQDDFASVPVDASFTIQNPQTGINETIVLEEAIDDLVIFVGAASQPFNGVSVRNAVTETGNLSSLAQAQYDGVDLQGDIFQRRISSNFRNGGAVTDFEPWVGTISFTTNPATEWDFSLRNPDLDKFDFVSIALHEIGHILGVGTAPIFDVLGADGAFDGVNAREINDGNPIPLEASLGHIDEGFRDNDVLLDSILEAGRQSPTEIDLAILADIGYEIARFTKQGELPEVTTAEGEFIIGAVIDQLINGLAGDDEIRGNMGSDTLLGDEGNDTLFGFTAADELSGGLGDDLLNGNEQNDTLLGDEGNDTLFGEDDNDVLFGGLGTDRLQGDLGDDTLRGNDGNDTLLGGEDNDLVVGNSGEDQLQGDVGNDILRGGEANDTLLGEAGDDTLEGGRGDDSLEGGTGNDRFEFGWNLGRDRINDFTAGEDAIVVSAKYDFATDTYDLNDPSEILDAITDTGEVADSTDTFTQITLEDSNTITVVHDEALTTEDFEIYFPFQPQVTTTPSGFTVGLSQDINLDRLNLYRGLDSNASISDLRLVGESTGEIIAGSVVANNDTLTFIQTDGILAPDDYTLTLFSRGNGFISTTGELLDGDLDGIAGDNLVTQFTVEDGEQRVLSLDDFVAGIGQINSPLDNENIAISLDDGAGVTEVDFTLTYDAAILTIEDIILSSAMGDDWTITTEDLTNPGTAIISLSGTTPLNSGIDLVELQAIASETATNGASGIVTLEDVSLNNGEIAAIGDSAYQQVAYVGDTDNDLNYSNTDAYNISLLATGISEGLNDFSLTNPQIIADINGDRVISAFDSYLITQLEII